MTIIEFGSPRTPGHETEVGKTATCCIAFGREKGISQLNQESLTESGGKA